ncbi:hypothetical protein BU15DRAFT_64913 [Melanogaster broomeanus]|nr:hypothetical protein BU15DRAFT_64913 [Melanogaster broomeanus]
MKVSSGLSLLYRILLWFRRFGEFSTRWFIRALSPLQLALAYLRKIFESRTSRDRCYAYPSLDAAASLSVPAPARTPDPVVQHVSNAPPTPEAHTTLAVPSVAELRAKLKISCLIPDVNVIPDNATPGDGVGSTSPDTPEPTATTTLGLVPHPINGQSAASLQSTLCPPGIPPSVVGIQPINGHSAASLQATMSQIPTPMIANDIRRYERGNVVKRKAPRVIIPPGEKEFLCHTQRIFTDADIREPEIEQKIASYAEKLRLWARHHLVDSDSMDIELALELYNDQNSKTDSCRYYYVDHQKRVLFWAHGCKIPTENVKGVKDLSHVKYAVEAEYWYVHPVRSLGGQKDFRPDSVWVTARLMRQFAKVKFVNWCGQPTARLDADQSIYATTSSHQRVSLLLRMLNPFLFRSPEAHLRTIRRMWVDEMVVRPRWKNFIDLLNKEWNQFTIFATVILAVDVSFLAIPGVLNTPLQSTAASIVTNSTSPSQSTSGTSLSQSPAAIGIFLSTLCAVGSLLVSVILSGQVNNQSRDSAKGVVSNIFCVPLWSWPDKAKYKADFMTKMTNSMLKRDSLAILHSLPFALLLWGMVFFSLALSYIIFHDNNLVTLLTVGPGWVLIFAFTLWPVAAAGGFSMEKGPDTKQESEDHEDYSTMYSSAIGSGVGSSC